MDTVVVDVSDNAALVDVTDNGSESPVSEVMGERPRPSQPPVESANSLTISRTYTGSKSIVDFSENISDVSVNAEKIRGQLRNAKHYGRMRRLRISVPSLAIGFTLVSITILGVLSRVDNDDGSMLTFWLLVPISIPMFVGMPMMLIAILPDDKRVIQVVGVFLILMLMLTVLYHVQFMYRGISISILSRDCEKEENADFPCHTTLPILPAFMFWAIFNSAQAVKLWKSMRRDHHPMVLRRIWTVLSQCEVVGGLCMILMMVMLLIASGKAREEGDIWQGLARNGAIGIAAISSGLLVGRQNFRVAVQAWLSSRQEAPAAAGIAAMLSGQTENELWHQAKTSFRFVPANRLKETDMRDNTPNPELRKLTQSGHLGAVDAFVSHSWHDDNNAKWEALQEWRREFKSHHGREPRLWIDKYCIDQGDIERSLACLPVYVAGCKQFLALCGPTYLHRLWCLMELFVFVEMGRTVESIVAFPVGFSAEGGLDNLLQHIRQFHASDATCYLPEDTERLLGIIESGSRGFEGLEDVVKKSLVQAIGLTRHSIEGMMDRSKELGSFQAALRSNDDDCNTSSSTFTPSTSPAQEVVGKASSAGTWLAADEPRVLSPSLLAAICEQEQANEKNGLPRHFSL